MTKRVLFRRRFQAARGAQLKAWDYFVHVRSSPDWEARVFFDPACVFTPDNPWGAVRGEALAEWRPYDTDVLFLSGVDWDSIPAAERDRVPVPVVTLVQSFYELAPDDPRSAHFAHPAVRICVSPELAEATRAAGANGRVVAIPNGIDLASLPAPVAKETDVVVVGMKERRLARNVARRVAGGGRKVDFVAEHVPRGDLLRRIARARVAAFLPKEKEGFYLPALEAMAMGTLVVCPDVLGNRSFCLDGRNCLRPPYDVARIAGAVDAALALAPSSRDDMLRRARETAEAHDLPRERRALLDLLADVVRSPSA